MGAYGSLCHAGSKKWNYLIKKSINVHLSYNIVTLKIRRCGDLTRLVYDVEKWWESFQALLEKAIQTN